MSNAPAPGIVPDEAYALQDLVMQRRIQEIVTDYKIKVIVETGIYQGLSTVWFAGLVETVFGIDCDPRCLCIASNNCERFKRSNVVLCLGNSPLTLKSLLPILPDETLYFLDAHWGSYWPLINELQTIRKGTGVIILHDMKVPWHPELGWDTYDNQPLDYNYVKEVLNEWSRNHVVEYNSETEGTSHPRGVGYIFPTQR